MYFSIRVSPDVLLWGTQWHHLQLRQQYMRGQNVFEHDNVQSGYSKYYPGQKRTDVDRAGVPFDLRINQRGFRGADYTLEKPAGALRVVTLGGSSTFGFGNRDDETYPFLLEQLLNDRFDQASCGSYTHAEVINLGIPHLDSSQLAELFVAEGLLYQPDVVTIYSGYNNTLGLAQVPWVKQWARHSLLINFIRVASQQRLRLTASQLQREMENRSSRFIDGLQNIWQTAESMKMIVLPITQQVRALPPEIIRQQKISYDQEIENLEHRLNTGQQLSLLEAKVVVHSSLTRALRSWVQLNGLQLVDAIELLDQHRYLLTTYVHLAPLANQLIALALADSIASATACPQLQTPLAE